MTTLRNTELELIAFRLRIRVAISVVIVVFGLLTLRLVWLQIIHHRDYLTQSEENRTSVIPLTPSRGLILDRNGVVLARNYSAYTLEITPSKVKNIEAVIDDLSTFITITARDRSRFKKLSKDSPKLSSFPNTFRR
jgi:penicillin-binding protein 2